MNEISIRIFWGPWDGKFNPSPIVSVGNVVGSIIPSAPVVVREEQSWKIKIDERKSVFTYYSKERCLNSDDYIQLLVCVFFPKGQKLEGEKSPLELLDNVMALFGQLFIFDLQAELPPKEKVDAAFAQLLSGYILDKCPWYVFNMEGSNPASFCVESRAQLDALMRFNAYPALAHVAHLELGFNCETTVDINTKGKVEALTEKKRPWWKRRTNEEKPKSENIDSIRHDSQKVSEKEAEERTIEKLDNKDRMSKEEIAVILREEKEHKNEDFKKAIEWYNKATNYYNAEEAKSALKRLEGSSWISRIKFW